jgi:two-component sensor histidine kinase
MARQAGNEASPDIPNAYRLFFKQSIRSMGPTASMFPSSRYLANALTRPIDFRRARTVVELGPGTGAVTNEILKRMRPDAKLFAVDINETFIDHLRSTCQDPRLVPLRGSATELLSLLAVHEIDSADAIVSSLGLTGMDHRTRLSIMRQIGELVCDRDTPFSTDDEALLEAIAHHAAVALEHGRAVMRGVLAQEIHHRVKNNLQSVASLLRLQARAENVDARKSLQDSVNRILAIAAVHEVLTEHREDDVDLGELVDRLRAMLVQGLVAGKDVSAELESVSLAGQRATALALVFTELFQNALEHGGEHVAIALGRRNAEVILTISDDGDGIDGEQAGTGLSIVRALVRDELHGELALENAGGLRAEVVFPA